VRQAEVSGKALHVPGVQKVNILGERPKNLVGFALCTAGDSRDPVRATSLRDSALNL